MDSSRNSIFSLIFLIHQPNELALIYSSFVAITSTFLYCVLVSRGVTFSHCCGVFTWSAGYGSIRDLGWGVGQQRGCPLALGSALTHAEQHCVSGMRLARTAVRLRRVPVTLARASWITPGARGPPTFIYPRHARRRSAECSLVMWPRARLVGGVSGFKVSLVASRRRTPRGGARGTSIGW